MLLGLTRPSAGEVRICGHDLVSHRFEAAARIGALLEARATYDHLTGRDNIEITRRMLRLPVSETDRVLALVGLTAAGSRRVGQYSLGMRQRLGLARALIGTPELVILDEPMNGLDPEGMAEMRETIRSLPASAGVTVFLSSHLLDEVEQVATHVGLMRDGRLIAQGELADLLGLKAPRLFIRTADDRRGAAALEAAGWRAAPADGGILATGGNPEEAARTIVGAGLGLRELSVRRTDLESLYLDLAQRKAA
jgi:ABC-2 type transport system ATP-binding protein